MESDASGDDPDSSLRAVFETVRGRYAYKVAAAVLVVTAVLLAGGYFAFVEVQAEVQADAEETLVSSAEREAAGIEGFINDREADARRLSSSITGSNSIDIRREFGQNLAILPDTVEHIYYFDAQSKEVVVSTNRDLEGESVADRPWATDQDVFTTSESVRSFEPYRVDGEPRMGFASPVPGRDNRTLAITVDLTEQSQLMTAPVDGAEVEVVSTRTGEVALARDTDAILDEFFLQDELPHLQDGVDETRVDQVSNDDRSVVDDDQVVVATVPIEGKSWAVAVVAPESVLFDTVPTVTQYVLLLIGIAVVGLVGLGAVVSRDVNNSLDEMTGYAEAIEDGDLGVDIDRSRADEFGQLAVLFSRIRDTLQERLDEVEQQAAEAEAAKEDAEAARAEAEAAKEEAESLSRHLEQKAGEYRAAIEAAAEGDFTRRLDPESESDAMTDIAEALNEMLDDIEDLVVQIQSTAREVDEQSSEVTASTEEIESTATEVAESVEEISAGAESQNNDLAAAAEEMSELSATIEEIASSSDEVAETARQATEWGEEGREAATDAIDQMDLIEGKADDTVEEMEALRREVERIGDAVELIDDIAEQTNILALNASIEAASAGEGGDGFAVVADEVKDLAEETAEATQEVEDLIENVEASTDAVAEDMFEMQENIADGRETVEATVDALESIVDGVEDASAGLQTINDATDEQADSAQEVVTMVDDISDVSEETADQAQNVSAAAEEQSSAIAQISDSAASLSDRAQELEALVDEFDVGDSPTVPEPAEPAADDD